eukprot:CAMPEP_0179315154 /NCGR_PEP_ID=MMETSP0797-20121207/54896_1 /TAXON_ID=47934 /ORGANISM="Dinophysis acuminata, Strain DAEP01" /LENGTH=50 /DNA_ID=CAMNT_0021025631 /DNA_START=67 /DNA_END=216 /DNA_ORIENTATION=-
MAQARDDSVRAAARPDFPSAGQMPVQMTAAGNRLRSGARVPVAEDSLGAA